MLALWATRPALPLTGTQGALPVHDDSRSPRNRWPSRRSGSRAAERRARRHPRATHRPDRAREVAEMPAPRRML